MMHSATNSPLAHQGQRQVARFLCVGGAAAGVYFAVVHGLAAKAGLPGALAVSAGYACSVAFHFLANRRYTFGQRGHWSAAQVLRYLAVAAANYVLTMAVVALLTRVVATGLYLAVACAILATTSLGFVASRHWVFRPPEACDE